MIRPPPRSPLFPYTTLFRSSRRRVVELLRQINPDVVLTSSPIDYMCDHEATSALVRDACFAAPALNFATRDANAAPPIPKIPDRKSTRLNSSHLVISYAVFC